MRRYGYKRVTFLLEPEIALRVAIADVLHHLSEERKFRGGQKTFLYLSAQQVAQDAPEILMARIGEEAARVGQHPHETAQEAERGERLRIASFPVRSRR